eukprot:15058864-Alexandrium_andersonii.AAC.1
MLWRWMVDLGPSERRATEPSRTKRVIRQLLLLHSHETASLQMVVQRRGGKRCTKARARQLASVHNRPTPVGGRSSCELLTRMPVPWQHHDDRREGTQRAGHAGWRAEEAARGQRGGREEPQEPGRV